MHRDTEIDIHIDRWMDIDIYCIDTQTDINIEMHIYVYRCIDR